MYVPDIGGQPPIQQPLAQTVSEDWQSREPYRHRLQFLVSTLTLSVLLGTLGLVLFYACNWGGMDWPSYMVFSGLLMLLAGLSISNLKAQALRAAEQDERAALLNTQVLAYLSMNSDGNIATGLPCASGPAPPPPPMYTVVVSGHRYKSSAENPALQTERHDEQHQGPALDIQDLAPAMVHQQQHSEVASATPIGSALESSGETTVDSATMT